jgi:hypothetical protein
MTPRMPRHTKERAMLNKIFPRNEHLFDRVIRVVLGLLVLSLVFVGPQSLWGLVGLVPLITGLVGSCPLYTLFGLSTCPLDRKPSTSRI